MCHKHVVGSKISSLIVHVGCSVRMVFSVTVYSGDSFLSVLRLGTVTDTSHFSVWECTGKSKECGHTYVF